MELLIPLAGVVVGVLAATWRARAARRRRASVQVGAATRCRARLEVDGGPLARGRLTMSPHVLVWHGRGSGPVDLAGARVLSAVVEPRQRQARADDAALQLLLPSDSRARLLLHHDDAGLVVQLLQRGVARQAPDAAVPPRSPRRVRVWPRLGLGLAALWVAGWAWLVLTGYTAEATVVSNDREGGCGVTWVGHDGHRHHAEVDCGDPEVGDSPVRLGARAPVRRTGGGPGPDRGFGAPPRRAGRRPRGRGGGRRPAPAVGPGGGPGPGAAPCGPAGAHDGGRGDPRARVAGPPPRPPRAVRRTAATAGRVVRHRPARCRQQVRGPGRGPSPPRSGGGVGRRGGPRRGLVLLDTVRLVDLTVENAGRDG